ncbi:AraC family transcriptional regulator [Vibrio vulnificus]|uniref:AraC family transcriptional regulator n=1 Tax=Vibrio vulnificus TaxID=672 RepID=UPI00102AECBB|nr:AraC family transcriptional regulator [Vibrio vulnificus]EGR7974842.1 AraC family transcriptional regulator [Vibrio vulnificus]EIY9460245.1 AraC family transcriptional regulator [Vibrio vulnificus]MCU8107623.1 AraC family transcriptional regulator [Vibrio vulnificus]RZR43569.1 AraC family transcriptional regulator [Vibrio vulnificus]HAS8471168.1 AraC family transcriptional regulator [Vibrio vulnificus]
MEVMSDILRAIRVVGSVYFCSQVEAPWTKTFNDLDHASFHMIRRGACWANVDGRIEQLNAGDLIFLGPGQNHLLSSQSPEKGKSDLTESTLLLCGSFSFTRTATTPLLDVFPRVTIVRDQDLAKYPWLRSTFDQLSSEYLSQGPGSELIVNKLTEIILVELIRINFGREQTSPFLEALNDKRISRALQLLHDHPETAWTLEAVANQIGMSRAAFANRFSSLVGKPMFEYLTNLRMQKAQELLVESLLPIDEIAEQVGYESERAFTLTFKKHTGTTPKRFRAQ